MKAEMAVGYTVEKDSYQWTWDKTKRQYGILVLLALVVYFITAIQFESLKQPFVIILMIPLSFIGLFLTFSTFNVYFDQGGYAAFILLGGLVVNACIYIVNDLNNTKHRILNTRIIRAVSGKMTSIILIITATCLGLVPFLLGKANEVFWFGLAAGTIGGLVFSLILIFIALPVFLSKKE
jgi:multidrug efflux pump subunit AcrB